MGRDAGRSPVSRRPREGITDDPHAGFERAGRSTRPRTKERPTYDEAVDGVVVSVDRGRFRCHLAGLDAVVSAIKVRSLARGSVIVGDRVRLVGDTSGTEGTLARIVEVAHEEVPRAKWAGYDPERRAQARAFLRTIEPSVEQASLGF